MRAAAAEIGKAARQTIAAEQLATTLAEAKIEWRRRLNSGEFDLVDATRSVTPCPIPPPKPCPFHYHITPTPIPTP